MKKMLIVVGAIALCCVSYAQDAVTTMHVIETEPVTAEKLKVVTEAEWTATLKRIETLESQMVYLKPLAEMRRKARETAAEKSKRKMEERLQTIRATESIRRKLEKEQGLMRGAKPRLPKKTNAKGEKVK